MNNTERNNLSQSKDENQFGEHLPVILNGTLDRENRQTFASHKGEEEPLQSYQFEQHLNKDSNIKLKQSLAESFQEESS